MATGGLRKLLRKRLKQWEGQQGWNVLCKYGSLLACIIKFPFLSKFTLPLLLNSPTFHYPPLPVLPNSLNSNYSSRAHFSSIFSRIFVGQREELDYCVKTIPLPISSECFIRALDGMHIYLHNTSLGIQTDAIVLSFLVTSITPPQKKSPYFSLNWLNQSTCQTGKGCDHIILVSCFLKQAVGSLTFDKFQVTFSLKSAASL